MADTDDWAERLARKVAHSMPPSDLGSSRAIRAVASALRDARREALEEAAADIDKQADEWSSQHRAELASELYEVRVGGLATARWCTKHLRALAAGGKVE